MPGKRTPPQTALDRAIASVLEGSEMAPMIIPAARNGRKEIIRHAPTKIENIRDTIIRIQTDADPIGFLIAVQNGALIECVSVGEEDSDIEPGMKVLKEFKWYEQASPKQRIEAARFLANKVLPSLSVQKHIVEKPEEGVEEHYVPNADGAPSFAQIVAIAAGKANDVAATLPPQRIYVTEPKTSADGRPVYNDSAGEGLEDEAEG
jgi:hypothetical protein